MFGVSSFLIGVTVVAFGTSSPKLATAVISKLCGHDEVGIGTILGSNVFYCLFIIGLAGAIHLFPQSVTAVLPSVVFGVLTILALIPLAAATLGRGRGVVLLALYAASILAAWWFSVEN
jgi:cation:H+ antiporter